MVTEVALLATLALGCGSSGEDTLVLRFVGFNADNISQEDIVLPTSAVVCVPNPNRPADMLRSFTPTTINAIFTNEEQANIHLNTYTVHFNDPTVGLADVTASLTGNPTLIGGRCSSTGAACAVDTDCISTSGTSNSTTMETCDHTDSTAEGIVLVDLTAKAHVNPAIFGQTTSLTVTFIGADDAHRTFEVPAGYAVVFNDRFDCGTSTGPTPAESAVATPTPTPTPTPTLPTPTPTTTPGVS
jgi:hypothetical protein